MGLIVSLFGTQYLGWSWGFRFQGAALMLATVASEDLVSIFGM